MVRPSKEFKDIQNRINSEFDPKLKYETIDEYRYYKLIGDIGTDIEKKNKKTRLISSASIFIVAYATAVIVGKTFGNKLEAEINYVNPELGKNRNNLVFYAKKLEDVQAEITKNNKNYILNLEKINNEHLMPLNKVNPSVANLADKNDELSDLLTESVTNINSKIDSLLQENKKTLSQIEQTPSYKSFREQDKKRRNKILIYIAAAAALITGISIYKKSEDKKNKKTLDLLNDTLDKTYKSYKKVIYSYLR